MLLKKWKLNETNYSYTNKYYLSSDDNNDNNNNDDDDDNNINDNNNNNNTDNDNDNVNDNDTSSSGGNTLLTHSFWCLFLNFCSIHMTERISWKEVSEWLNLTAFLGTADIEVNIVHISRVIIAYTLESLSSLTQITHNLQATIYFTKKDIKKETQKSEVTHSVDLSLEMATLHQFTLILNT